MAVVLGTSAGFVLTAPTADPNGTAVTSDGSSFVVKDTAPTGAVKIVEVGWYKASGTTSSNTQVGLYADTAGVAAARLNVTGDQASGTSAGWIVFTGLDWPVIPGNAYWLGMQHDAHTGSSQIDSETSGGAGIDTRTSQTALNDPYGGGAVSDADGIYAIYAKYQSAPTVALNSPADTSSDSDTTPTLDFTGTDAQSNDVRYEVQVATSAFADISSSNLTGGNDIDGDSSSTTASVSPTGNKLQLLTVASRTGITADPNEPTATGNGLTWVVEKSVIYDNTSSSRRRLTTFRAMGASPSSGTITIDFGGQAQTSVRWSLDEFTNIDTSGTNGSGAIVQSVSNFDPDADVNTLTVTLSAFSNVNNATFGAFGSADAETLAVGSGFTLVSEGESNADVHLLVEFKTSNDTSVDMSKATVSELGGIAIEIKNASQSVIDAVSGTDAGFANPDTGGDTDPFNSGENIQYTVQSALTPGTTYYWRVRGLDPSGSNTYGAWATTRSFTILTAALTGTVTASITEADIVTGGKTIILTLTGDTWIAAGAGSFDLQRDEIIAGIDSAQSEATGWDLVPKATQSITGVARTSDTVVTLTLDAFATYNITAQETITATIPSTALTGGVAVVASPTFTIDTAGGGGTVVKDIIGGFIPFAR